MTVVINGTTGITDVNGTAAAPAITGTDTDTGVFFGTNTVSLSTNGTERLQVDASGNLGLGVTPSASWSGVKAIQLGASAAVGGSTTYSTFSTNAVATGSGWTANYLANGYATLYAQQVSNGQHQWFNAASGTAGNAITFTQAMTLDASGNLGVGTTSPSYRLEVRDTADAVIALVKSGANSLRFLSTSSGGVINQVDNNPLAFYTNNTERARIDSSGNLLVGTTSTLGTSGAGTTHIAGGGSSTNQPPLYLRNTSSTAGRYWKVGPTNDAGYIIYNENNTGQYMVYGGSTWNSSSDERLKTNLVPIQNAAQKVSTLRAVTGRYITDEETVSRSFLIAQDVQAVLPEAVDVQDNEQKTLGLGYTAVIPLLVAAIKEQQAIIQQLQADVAALKGNA